MGRREVDTLLRDATRPTWRAVLAAADEDEFIIVALTLVSGGS